MKFIFAISRFFGTNYNIVTTDNKIKFVASGIENPARYSGETISPEPEQREKFWEFMKNCNEWHESYVNTDVMDGTQWSVDAEDTELKVNSYGDNNYPPNRELFLAQLNKLLGRIDAR